MEPDYLLQHQIRSCQACPLAATRHNAVPAEVGSSYEIGGLAIMAEAPGEKEDLAGRPMVGPAGKLLDKLFAEAGFSREDVVLLNRIRCRPLRNKMDSPEAIAGLLACAAWTTAELEAYQPSVVVLMGKTALTPVFGALVGVGAVAGHCRTIGNITYVATYHPAAALYRDAARVKDIIVRDLRLAKEMIDA